MSDHEAAARHAADTGAADVGLSVNLTAGMVADLVAGFQVDVFIEADPREGLDRDVEIFLVPPQKWNGS